MTTEPTVADAPLYADPRVHQRRWLTLVMLCLSLMVISIGNTSLNLALPVFARDLHAATSELQWVVAGYSLVFAGFLFTAGALGDRFGRKGTLQFGLALFLVAAALATSSHQMWQLIACRAVMGLAGAFIMPSTLSILINVFPPHERPKAIAIWASVIGVSGSLGTILSGALLQKFWYGSVFLINVPLVAIALIGGRFWVPKTRNELGMRLDPGGAAISIIAMTSAAFGLIEAPDKGWGSATTVGAFCISALAVLAFILWERRTSDPMIDLALFRRAPFSAGSAGMMLMYVAIFGMMFLMAQYLQLVRNAGPLDAAIRMTPFAFSVLLVGPITPKLVHRFGSRVVIGMGLGLWTLSMFAFMQVTRGTPYALVALIFAGQGAGFSVTQPSMTSAIMSAVPHHRAGVGSAMNDTVRELGASLGVAIVGSLAASRFHDNMMPITRGLAGPARATAQSSLAAALRVAETLKHPQQFATDARDAFMASMHWSLTAGVVAAVSAAVIVIRYMPRDVAHGRETALNDKDVETTGAEPDSVDA